MNDLVPVDELHWDDITKSFNVLSRKQTEEVIEACLRVGMKSSSDILKVLKEYETAAAGVLLFNQFLSGRVGIYGFDPEGSPVFERIREEELKEVTFWSFDSEEAAADHGEFEEIQGRFVSCDSEAEWGIFELYKAALDFCKKWGVDLVGGESPEGSTRHADDPDFISDLRRRSWSVVEVERGEEATRIRMSLFGMWLRTKH